MVHLYRSTNLKAMKNLKIPMERINVIEITEDFKVLLFERKICPQSESCPDRTKLNKQAMKSITYNSNMPFYKNLITFDSHFIPVISQSLNQIESVASITFLN